MMYSLILLLFSFSSAKANTKRNIHKDTAKDKENGLMDPSTIQVLFEKIGGKCRRWWRRKRNFTYGANEGGGGEMVNSFVFFFIFIRDL